MITFVGLGSGGCRFLAELPADSELTERRIAIDSDAKILQGIEGARPVFLKIPKGYAKLPSDSAFARMRDAWDAALPSWLSELHDRSRLVLLSVALGGVTGTCLAPLFLEAMRQRKLPTVTLVLKGNSRDERASLAMMDILSLSIGVCMVNAQQLGQSLDRQVSVQSWMGLCSSLRMGHALDWQRVTPFLAGESLSKDIS